MYEVFEHTADLGLRIRADNPEDLFIEGAHALFSLLVANRESVQCVESHVLEVAGDDLEYLFFDWLSELLYLFSTERLLFAEFDVKISEQGVQAECRGERADFNRHTLEHEVKAITYHELHVERQQDHWLAEVIVDI